MTLNNSKNIKVIAFSFSGGNKYSFQNFSQNLSNFVVLEYPGRGFRIQEKLLTTVDLLIEDLLPKIANEIASCEQYIIYGHSMGATVGYLICQKIKELGWKMPLKLVVSGRKPPKYPLKNKLSNLSNEEFWEKICRLGGVPKELSNYPKVIEFYIPILKADFECIEKYKYDVNAEKLSIPIDVFYGSDEGINEGQISGWKDETNKEVRITKFKGNHFFIFEHKEFFNKYFKNLQLNETI